MITRLDYYVGEVLNKLKEKGLDENTIVIFTSDNGPMKKGADPTFFGRDGKLRGLKRQCYEGGFVFRSLCVGRVKYPKERLMIIS